MRFLILFLLSNLVLAKDVGTCLYTIDNDLFNKEFPNIELTETINVNENNSMSLSTAYKKDWSSFVVKEGGKLSYVSKEKQKVKIKNLTLFANSSLELGAGEYYIDYLNIQGAAKIKFSGKVSLYVKEEIDFKNGTELYTNYQHPENLLIVSQKNIKFGKVSDKLSGVFAAKHSISFENKSTVKGFLLAKNIKGLEKVNFIGVEKAVEQLKLSVNCWQDNSLFTATHLDLKVTSENGACSKDVVKLYAKQGRATSISYNGMVNLLSTEPVDWQLIKGKGKLYKSGEQNRYIFSDDDKGEATFAIRYLGSKKSFKVWAEDNFESQIASRKKKVKSVKKVSSLYINEKYATSGQEKEIVFQIDDKCNEFQKFNETILAKVNFEYNNPKAGDSYPVINGKQLSSKKDIELKFVDSKAKLKVNYDDVGKLRFKLQPLSRFNDTEFDLVFKPYLLRVDIPNNEYPNHLKKAGEHFTVIVNAENAKQETVNNFGKEKEGIKLQLELAENQKGKLFNANKLKYEKGIGFIAKDISFNSVGDVHLKAKLANSNYLGAGDVESSAPTLVGNFVPNHFDIKLNEPKFLPSCVDGRFTYLGDKFEYSTLPRIEVSAKNSSNELLEDYKNWKEVEQNIQVQYQSEKKLEHENVHWKLIDSKSGVAIFEVNNHKLSLINEKESLPFEPNVQLKVSIGETEQSQVVNFLDKAKVYSKKIEIGKPRSHYGKYFVADVKLNYFTENGYILNDRDSCTKITKNDILSESEFEITPVINGISIVQLKTKTSLNSDLRLKK